MLLKNYQKDKKSDTSMQGFVAITLLIDQAYVASNQAILH